MFEIHCFLQIMLMQANFGNLQGVFPVPICKILTCTLDKKFPGTETHFETWDIFWADKGRKGNGVETRTFNSCYGGNSTSSSRVSRKGIRASLVFFAERHEQLHQLIYVLSKYIYNLQSGTKVLGALL